MRSWAKELGRKGFLLTDEGGRFFYEMIAFDFLPKLGRSLSEEHLEHKSIWKFKYCNNVLENEIILK